MADKVIPIRPNKSEWSDGLLGLPEPPPHLMYCGWCKKHVDEVDGWVSQVMGCASCAPRNDVPSMMLSAATSQAEYMTDQHTRLLEGARDALKGRGHAKLRAAVELWDYNERQRLAASPPPEDLPNGSEAAK